MLTDLFSFELRSKLPVYNTASIARIDFPKPTATDVITRKEEARMRY